MWYIGILFMTEKSREWNADWTDLSQCSLWKHFRSEWTPIYNESKLQISYGPSESMREHTYSFFMIACYKFCYSSMLVSRYTNSIPLQSPSLFWDPLSFGIYLKWLRLHFSFKLWLTGCLRLNLILDWIGVEDNNFTPFPWGESLLAPAILTYTIGRMGIPQ